MSTPELSDRPSLVQLFFRACAQSDTRGMAELLARDPSLVHARDEGDNASALHFAAAHGSLEVVRLLIDAGADVHGAGDLHNGDVIGWAARKGNEAVVDLLLERGARHHIFSAMALGDRDLVKRLVNKDPAQLQRRRSRFENAHTPVLASFVPPDNLGWLAGQADYAMLELLIELGADIEATDDKGRSPLALAMLRGDADAMRLLKAAGATVPRRSDEAVDAAKTASAVSSVAKSVPMFNVADMRATVAWYESIGFTVHDRYDDGPDLAFARLSFGGGEFALTSGREAGPRGVTLWFFTDRIDDLYAFLKARQLGAAHARLAGRDPEEPDVPFAQDLFDPFYGGHQFNILDINGLELIFWQPPWAAQVSQ